MSSTVFASLSKSVSIHDQFSHPTKSFIMKILPCRHSPPFRPPFSAAFSLIEVVLSVAIASLGFTTMLGLLPHGMQLVQDSAQMSAESRIKQKLAGELQTAAWEQLNWTGYGPSRYFSDQGIELSKTEVAGNGGVDSALTYVASVQLPLEPLDIRLPAAGRSQEAAEPFLRRVKICIATSSDPRFDFKSAPPRRVRSHTAILAKTDG
jgi:uncharacterized protein (TIGR02598 family)